MIQEDYVSFETAKLLKEKGFNEICYACYEYFSSSITMYSGWHFEYKGEPVHNSKDIITCPTLQMAMKWLREVHNLCIEPYRTASGYLYTISKIWTGSEIYSDEFNGDDENSGQWTTYEKACEAAIKYCLENLI